MAATGAYQRCSVAAGGEAGGEAESEADGEADGPAGSEAGEAAPSSKHGKGWEKAKEVVATKILPQVRKRRWPLMRATSVKKLRRFMPVPGPGLLPQ